MRPALRKSAGRRKARRGLFAGAIAVLAKFGQHTLGEFGVQERYFLCVRANLGFFIDEAYACRLRVGEVCDYIVGVKRHMVDSAVGILFQEFCNRAVGRGGFKQLYMNSANGEKSRLYFLIRNFFDSFAFEAESVFVVGDGVVN